MADAQQKSWSNNPNAPKISYDLYFAEKASLAGTLIATVLYGILVMLFFQCVASLLNPVKLKREGVKWGLVFYTVVMFSCATIVIWTANDIASVSFIDNREFPGVEGVSSPGPLGYQRTICSGVAGIAPIFVSSLSYWLADGLLLYRCHVIYGRNPWAIAFPCLLYLGTIAMGIAILASHSCGWGDIRFILPHLSISVSLNVLLTLMIVIRLILHDRAVRAAIGSPTGTSRLCKTIVTMLIESSALYAVNSLLLIALWAAGNAASGIFLPIIAQNQVIAPLLIIQRVANRNALTSSTTITEDIGRSQSPSGDHILPVVYPMVPVDNYGKNNGEVGVRVVEATIDLRRDGEV